MGGQKRELHVNKKYLVFLPTAFLIVALDQLTKYCVTARMLLHESIAVIGGFLNITYVRNPGAAFGFLAHTTPFFRFSFFVLITLLAIGLIFFYVVKAGEENPCLILALSSIFGGAAGNLIDRLRYGEVVDFIDVYVKSHHWPAFNIADSAISLGAFFLLLEFIKEGKEKNRQG
jgi:signal peptidase II